MLNKKALAATAAGEAIYIEDVFSTYLYTGTGSALTITNGIDLSGEGGLVWIKNRGLDVKHSLSDTVRGYDKNLATNTTAAQQTEARLSGFTSSGFSLTGGYSEVGGEYNYASWTFRKAEKFFDVVTYTGTSGAQRISHNLGSVPGCIIVKEYTQGSSSWWVYHRSLGINTGIFLNSTNASATYSGAWGSSDPTSTDFGVGSGFSHNTPNSQHVAYLFAHDAGGFGDSGSESVIKCGSFTVNGSGNSTISLGWEPQYLLMKQTNTTGNWLIHDTMRGQTADSGYSRLLANTSDAETSSTTGFVRINATGFSINGATGLTGDHIYIAIRRGPMKTPEAGTEVFEPFVDRTSIGNKVNGTMGPVDLGLQTQVSTPFSSATHFSTFDRLRGSQKLLATSSTNAEGSGSVYFDTNQGVRNESWFTNGGVGYNFKRAPGFFDVVCFNTDSSNAASFNHNLGVSPELIIVKRRNGAESWWVWHNSFSSTQYLVLNSTNAVSSGTPTLTASSTSITLSANWLSAASSPYIAYIFASVAGVSKTGSYTGTGTTLQINCGFTGGARFVMIKRKDSTGDWYVWDTARGIVSGNDPYLLMNSTAAEVTNTDYIDTYSQGFEISSTAPAAINANGGTFIYLAIA